MKKVFLIGLVLLLLGAAVFGAGWYVTGGDFGVLNGRVGPVKVQLGGRKGFEGARGAQQTGEGDYAEKRYDFSVSGVEKLKITERDSPLRVTASPDRQIHLICRESGEYYYEISNDGGTLRMERTDREPFTISLFGDARDAEAVLQLPVGMGGEIELKCENARLTLDGLRLDEQGMLHAFARNGRVEAADLSAAGVTLTSENARVEAKNVSAALLTAESQNGSVRLTDCAAGVSVLARSDNGSIHVDGLSAGEGIRLESSNGSIEGTLLGSIRDYAVTASAQNGSSSLPERGGRGDIELIVRSSNGSIRLEFAGV